MPCPVRANRVGVIDAYSRADRVATVRWIESDTLLRTGESFACGDKRSTAKVGSFVLAPRAIEHTFMTWDQGPVKILQITSPARFERFAADMGRVADEPVLPDPAPFDEAFVEKLLSVAPRYGLEFRLGPPPE